MAHPVIVVASVLIKSVWELSRMVRQERAAKSLKIETTSTLVLLRRAYRKGLLLERRFKFLFERLMRAEAYNDGRYIHRILAQNATHASWLLHYGGFVPTFWPSWQGSRDSRPGKGYKGTWHTEPAHVGDGCRIEIRETCVFLYPLPPCDSDVTEPRCMGQAEAAKPPSLMSLRVASQSPFLYKQSKHRSTLRLTVTTGITG